MAPDGTETQAPVEQQAQNPEGLLRKNAELLEEKKKVQETLRLRNRTILELKYPGLDLDGVEDLPFEQADQLLARAKQTFTTLVEPAAQTPVEPPAVIRDWQGYEQQTAAASTSTPTQMTYAEAHAKGMTPMEIGRGLSEGIIV